jgi:hypothetical protein
LFPNTRINRISLISIFFIGRILEPHLFAKNRFGILNKLA